jgi:hypothetical protein
MFILTRIIKILTTTYVPHGMYDMIQVTKVTNKITYI